MGSLLHLLGKNQKEIDLEVYLDDKANVNWEKLAEKGIITYENSKKSENDCISYYFTDEEKTEKHYAHAIKAYDDGTFEYIDPNYSGTSDGIKKKAKTTKKSFILYLLKIINK